MKYKLTLAAVVLLFGQPMNTASLSFDESAAKQRPVNRVITLLKDMLSQLGKEAEDDEATYDEMACWCETNDKEITAAIANAEAHLDDLTARISDSASESAALDAEIKQHERDIASRQNSMNEANAFRTKQQAEFNDEKAELLQSIQALDQALGVLSKHISLLQMPHSGIRKVAATLRHVMSKHTPLVKNVFTRSEQQAISSLIQMAQPGHSRAFKFAQTSQSNGAHAPAPPSGQIFGILSDMKVMFESSLAASRKEEEDNKKAYETVKSTKEMEIRDLTNSQDEKVSQLATANLKHAESNQDKASTATVLHADQEFQLKLKVKCQGMDAEWEDRQKTRNNEMKAVSDALTILSGAAAHDLFTRTFNPSTMFMQKQGVISSKRRREAVRFLSTVAKTTHNPRLAMFAQRVKIDAFTAIKASIRQLIDGLVKHREHDVKLKDVCTRLFHENSLDAAAKKHEYILSENIMSDLEHQIEELQTKVNTLSTQVQDAEKQLAAASATRAAERKDFEETIADQRETQKLLKKALKILERFYNQPSLIQTRVTYQETPRGSFETYELQSNRVLIVLDEIILDAKKMEETAVKSEAEAQKAYEEFVMETNASINAKERSKTGSMGMKAEKEQHLEHQQHTDDDIKIARGQLEDEEEHLHQRCDFLLDNFNHRQKAFEEEVGALRQSIAILSGSNFGS